MDANIIKFLEDLLVEAGQDGLPEDIREQLILDLHERLERRLILAAVGGMTLAKQKEFEALSKTQPTPVEIKKFVEANVADADAVFKAAFADFRATYLGK